MMTLFPFCPFVDDRIDFERIGNLKMHYDSVYSNLTVKTITPYSRTALGIGRIGTKGA